MGEAGHLPPVNPTKTFGQIESRKPTALPFEYKQCLQHTHRNAFVRKVYAILSVELLITLGICVLCMYHAPVRIFCVANAGTIVWGSLIPTLLSLFACSVYKQSYPL